MGRRPIVSQIHEGNDAGWRWVSASHDGYRHQGVRLLKRVVAVSDAAVACFDKGSAKGQELVGYVHFHPEVELMLQSSDAVNQTFRFQVSRAGAARSLTIRAKGVEIEKGWYCPEFGKRMVAPVIRYDLNESDDFLGWVLHDPEISCEIDQSQGELLVTMNRTAKFTWDSRC